MRTGTGTGTETETVAETEPTRGTIGVIVGAVVGGQVLHAAQRSEPAHCAVRSFLHLFHTIAADESTMLGQTLALYLKQGYLHT